MGRNERIVANAASHLEPGESVEQVALVKGPLSNYALLATDRNVYALKLGGLGNSKVKETTMKVPLGELVINVTGGGIAIGRRGTEEKKGWGRMPFQKIDPFVEYVQRASGTG